LKNMTTLRLPLLTLLLAVGLFGSHAAGQRPSPVDLSTPANQPGVVRADTMHLTVLSSISATDAAPGGACRWPSTSRPKS
jgi:hypothetical protein